MHRVAARCALGAMLALASSTVVPSAAAQQSQGRKSYAAAAAGLYFGGTSGYNGPFLAARYGSSLGRFVAVGGRAEYRDDDPSGGRSQSFGVGPELSLYVPGIGIRLYGVVGVLLDVVRVSSTSYRAPDLDSGWYLRPHAGFGFGLGTAAADIGLEVTYAVEGSTSYTMLGVGIQSRHHSGTTASVPAAYLVTNDLAPLSDRYRREPDYRGYTFAVDLPARTPLGHAVRGSVGIDFLQFDSWSTGAAEFLVGTVGGLVRTADGTFTLSWVPQVGAILFLEPSGTPPYPMGALSLEARVAYRGIGLFGGAGAALTYGPAGILTGIPWRLGVVVDL